MNGVPVLAEGDRQALLSERLILKNIEQAMPHDSSSYVVIGKTRQNRGARGVFVLGHYSGR
jgi:hypothetical protein